MAMMNNIKLLLGLTVLLFLSFYARAEDLEGKRSTLSEYENSINWENAEQNVFINIYVATENLEAGKPVPLIIEQLIRPHWHTYWKNSGDSGEPMHVNWQLPEGFTASELSWPPPYNQPVGPLLNFGYSDKAYIYQEIQPPSELPQGAIHLPVKFDILVCEDICIPESIEKTVVFNSKTEKPDQILVPVSFIREAKSYLPTPAAANKWPSTIQEQNGMMVLTITTDINEENLKLNDFVYFPYSYGLVEYPAPPEVTTKDNQIIYKQQRASYPLENIKNSGGVLVLTNKSSGERYPYELFSEIIKTNTAAEKKNNALSQPEIEPKTVSGLIKALLFALLGGLILNLMPCVLPVLSIKVLSLSKISEKSRSEARKHGLAYTAGIILSFLTIASLLIILKAGGSEIGWGFHLQNPVFILLLTYLFFLIGLNLSGYFDVGSHMMGIGQGQKMEGIQGSFMAGILAMIVATPCTAPFMATALGYALVQPAYVALSVFAALGLGLALPYLVISFIPALQHAMPRPGAWMVTFKEFLAFPMYGAVIWLLWILSESTNINTISIPLIGLLGVAFAIWLGRHSQKNNGSHTNIFIVILALFIAIGSVFSSIYALQAAGFKNDGPMLKFGQEFSPRKLEESLKTDHPVFVEMTAAWCVTCKINNYSSINIPQTKKMIEDNGIIYLIGDWTNYDADITAYLNKFGRNGVPIYIYYGAPDAETGKRPSPQILPQILLPSIIAEVFKPKA